MTVPDRSEHRLAVMTSWAFFTSFGFCFVFSGFSDSAPVAGLIGFACFAAGFIGHVIINRIFRVGFSNSQVALGLTSFTASVLCFIAACIFDPAFGALDVLIGLAGFGAVGASFVVYIMVNYGVRGSYAMMHRLHVQERRWP